MFGLVGNLEAMLVTLGYVALFGMVFAESGLFFGFFLPGDSLLFTAGLLAQRGLLDFNLVVIGTAFFAIAGDQVGYWMGRKYGRRFFVHKGDFFRDPEHIKRAEAFYAKHGKKTIVLARFVPVVRTFAPIVAGASHMDFATFVKYNVLGGIFWSISMVSAGYFLGGIPVIAENIELLVVGIIVLSLAPVALELLKARRKRA